MADPAPDSSAQVEFSTFEKLQILSGVVVQAEPFPESRNPSIKLSIDFGPPLGVRRSSAQLTRHYTPQSLLGSDVVAVVNFPPRRVAGFPSQVLVLGLVAADDPGDVVLVRPDRQGTRGRRLG